MKSNHRILVPASALLVGALFAVPAAADKSQDVIARSNGFPSGAHFNLNLHGKKELFTVDPTEESSGGSSVFISLYGDSTVEFVSNKKSSLTELTVLDKYAESLDGDPASVQLPYSSEGYYVFGRILGKPKNGQDGAASSVILTPSPDLQLYMDDPLNPDPAFGDATDGSTLMSLGPVATTTFLR